MVVHRKRGDSRHRLRQSDFYVEVRNGIPRYCAFCGDSIPRGTVAYAHHEFRKKGSKYLTNVRACWRCVDEEDAKHG